MTVHLTAGAHKKRRDGMCVMEAAAYIAGEPHSDHPKCVSPVIAEFLTSWNDGLPTDAERDRLLKPLLPLVLHTHTTPSDEQTRAWMATDWLVRVQAPVWLDLAGLDDHARNLRGLPALTSLEIAVGVQSVINAAEAAAWAATGAVAWDAAGNAARAAATAAARAAAGDAARAAARAAAGAWAVAGAAAWDAAWAAAVAAAVGAAGAWAWPTIVALQANGVALVQQMAAVGYARGRAYSRERFLTICGDVGAGVEAAPRA